MGLYHGETHEIHNQLDMLACLEMEETEGEKNCIGKMMMNYRIFGVPYFQANLYIDITEG